MIQEHIETHRNNVFQMPRDIIVIDDDEEAEVIEGQTSFEDFGLETAEGEDGTSSIIENEEYSITENANGALTNEDIGKMLKKISVK